MKMLYGSCMTSNTKADRLMVVVTVYTVYTDQSCGIYTINSIQAQKFGLGTKELGTFCVEAFKKHLSVLGGAQRRQSDYALPQRPTLATFAGPSLGSIMCESVAVAKLLLVDTTEAPKQAFLGRPIAALPFGQLANKNIANIASIDYNERVAALLYSINSEVALLDPCSCKVQSHRICRQR